MRFHCSGLRLSIVRCMKSSEPQSVSGSRVNFLYRLVAVLSSTGGAGGWPRAASAFLTGMSSEAAAPRWPEMHLPMTARLYETPSVSSPLHTVS